MLFTYEDESFTEGVTRHVDGKPHFVTLVCVMMTQKGDTGRQKRQQYVIQKLVEKLLTLGSVTKYEENSQNIRKLCKNKLYSRKIIPNCSNA